MIALLELLTVLLEYIDLSVILIFISKNSYCYKIIILPIMLALCSMLSGTYYAHNYASIIGGSLCMSTKQLFMLIILSTLKCQEIVLRQYYYYYYYNTHSNINTGTNLPD